MAVYAESIPAARGRLERIEQRLRYHYSRGWYVRRACNSATRRMTNRNKLRSWARVLEEAGYEEAATYCRDRLQGLEQGTITPPVRRRLGRTQVAPYVPIQPSCVNPTGPVFVEYEVTVAGEDV